LWVRSFHPSIAVRITDDGKLQRVVALQLMEVSKPEAGVVEARLTDRYEGVLKPERWTALQKAIDASGFWQLPHSKPHLGVDGESCMVEARLQNHYHVVDQYAPEGGFAKLCALFVEEADRLLPYVPGLEGP
jgi:hypothetical protein